MAASPQVHQRAERCVDAIIEAVGKDIRIGLPLGLGKAVHIINALYDRACKDTSINLHILTALSLEAPSGGASLERRFLQPFVERLYGDVPQLNYTRDLKRGKMPDNIKLSEFFFKAGSRLHSPNQQQNYICTNYTHAVRDLLALGVNVVAQMVAPHPEGEPTLSLSCNPDLSLDLIPALHERQAAGEAVAVVGEVNRYLPFMPLDAEVPADSFDILLDNEQLDYPLFSAPPMAIEPQDHLIGLYASALIRDGGTLQVGIGSLGSALVYSVRLRHQNNEIYRRIREALKVSERFPVASRIGGDQPFETGLYGCSEMMVDGFLHLYEAGILKREVFADEALQRLLNDGHLSSRPSLAMLDRLHEEGLIESPMRARDLEWLQEQGVVWPEVVFKGGQWLIGGASINPDLGDDEGRQLIETHALREKLAGGVVMHGGFYLGPEAFYELLRKLTPEERSHFCMTSVNFINHLYDHRFGRQSLKAAQRVHARFVNSAMMYTLSGAAVSDGLSDGRVISGVGGQYNFVAMAHELPGAHSILTLRATREQGGKVQSNILFNYAHCTIPRHLRDIVITEYGIADLRGQPDETVYKELIKIADSRFQDGLLKQAQQAGKIARGWKIPAAYRNNTPELVEDLVSRYRERHGVFEPFPFGCDFTEEELHLGRALKTLKAATASRSGKLKTLWRAWREEEPNEALQPYLKRMGLDSAEGWREKLDRQLLIHALRSMA
ncbi:acetyl-CoA hydrolase/transferase C-terminal domain-containing protein [Marinobacteraceae bacterium S3BR75-40.1]